MDPNETAKFGDVNISMQTNVFEEVKLGDGEFLSTLKYCFLCGRRIDKKFTDHVDDCHADVTPRTLLDILEGKIDIFRSTCRDIYVVHYVYLQQKKSYGLTEKQEENHKKFERELNSMFKAIFDDKAY